MILTQLLSGLALFLFGMKSMSESLQKAAGERLRDFLSSVTKNKYTALLFGALFTAVIQSSGATTVMEVSLVNAGLMTLEQSIGITFGANIGTTITSQLVSLKLTAVAPFIIFIGAAIITFNKRPILQKIASIIFGFGALFLGINFMTEALGSLHNYPEVLDFFKLLQYPALAAFLGFALTLLVQSSSVTVSVLVLLADSGLVGLLSCLYFILGANIGSCAPAVVAGMSSNKEAKRTAFVHVMFNVVGLVVISAILLFAKEQVIGLITGVSGTGNAKRFVANADTLFKIFQAVILLPCTGGLIRLANILIPDSEEEEEALEGKRLLYIGKNTKFKESTALVDSVQEIERMAHMVDENLKLSMDALLNDKIELVPRIQENEDYIDYLSSEITEYLVEVNKLQLPLADAARIGGLFHVVIDIERIGDHVVNVAEVVEKRQREGILFTPEACVEMDSIFTDAIQIYEKSVRMFAGQHGHYKKILELEDTIDRKQIEYQERHVKRMSDGGCSIEAGLVFMDLLIGLERIGDHSTNIAHSVLKRKSY